jgi:hypothetical protein
LVRHQELSREPPTPRFAILIRLNVQVHGHSWRGGGQSKAIRQKSSEAAAPARYSQNAVSFPLR